MSIPADEKEARRWQPSKSIRICMCVAALLSFGCNQSPPPPSASPPGAGAAPVKPSSEPIAKSPSETTAVSATATESNPRESSPAEENAVPANVPEQIVDRLKTKIDVDFRRTPLFSAFEQIASKAKFDVTIDGDSLKLSGYTKNMTQDLKLDATPAAKVIQEILKKYDHLVIVVDEEQKLVTVTTQAGAKAKGQEPFSFGD